MEQGRSEERLRIAQDGIDNIGARLLTPDVPYPNSKHGGIHPPQDLKTLTRGWLVQFMPCRKQQANTLLESQRLGAACCDLTGSCRSGWDGAEHGAVVGADPHLAGTGQQHHQSRQGQQSPRQRHAGTRPPDPERVRQRCRHRAHDLVSWLGARRRAQTGENNLGGSVRWMANDPRGIAARWWWNHFSASAGLPTDPQVSH